MVSVAALGGEDPITKPLHLLVSEEIRAKYYFTNPSGFLGLSDGTIVFTVREQQKFYPMDVPPPGKSRIGIYKLDETRLYVGEFVGSRMKTLFEHPTYWYEDAFFVRLKDEVVVGVVLVQASVHPYRGIDYRYETLFFRFDENTKSIRRRPIARGPYDMKDIRIAQAGSGKIIVVTRPKGMVGGKDYGNGFIGVTEVSAVDEIEPSIIESAPSLLLPSKLAEEFPELEFADGFWVGANDATVRRNKLILYSHMGTHFPGPYLMFRSAVDLTTGEIQSEILADVESFGDIPPGPIRANTTFSGGVFRHPAFPKHDIITAGLNDTTMGVVLVPRRIVPCNHLIGRFR